MVVAFMIPALGSGAFHPVGTKYAAEADANHTASNLAYFFLIGQLGLALGPALSGGLLDHASTVNHLFTDALGPVFTGRLTEDGTVAPVLLLGIFAVPTVLFMLGSIPSRRSHRQEVESQPAVNGSRQTIPLLGLLILVAMVGLRSLGQPGAVNFIPVLFQAKGWTPSDYGLITSSFWIGSGLAGVFFGSLADRYDRRKVIAFSLLASAPAFFLLPAADGVLAFALAIAAGVLSGGSHSIIVSLAHDLLPSGSKALASGMILGLIFGMGALGNLLIGWLGDLIGLSTAFHAVAVVTVLAALLAFGLPVRRHAAETLVMEPEALV
jgi:FSR family fosmidomycin resistance protein-like MFS transporter